MADGGLAERLAEKWLLGNPEIVDTGNDAEDRRVCGRDARWWLNAIADELYNSDDQKLCHYGEYERDVYSGEVAAKWLRAQAKGESE